MPFMIFFERALGILFILWVGWLFTFNPDSSDAYDILLGGLTGFSIGWSHVQRKRIQTDNNELVTYAKIWRLVINIIGLIIAAIILVPKMPPGDISANLILGLFFVTFIYDLALRFKSWLIVKGMSREVLTSSGTKK